MDYDKFKEEYDKFQDWWHDQPKYEDRAKLEASNVIRLSQLEGKHVWNDDWLDIDKFKSDDRVNSPSHYTSGRVEAIDIIEDAVKDAPTPGKGVLQSQVLKYVLRVWLKDNPLEDLKKAQWYLSRLIKKLEEENR